MNDQENTDNGAVNKRQLLSYWKSKSLSTDDKEGEDELLEELRKTISEMESCFSHVVVAENEVNNLQRERLSIFEEMQMYFGDLVSQGKSNADNNDSTKSGQDDSGVESLEDEKKDLSLKNGQLRGEIESLKSKHVIESKDRQKLVEKLTQEKNNSDVNRKNLERELVQLKTLNEKDNERIKSLEQELATQREKFENEISKLSRLNEQVSTDNRELVEKGKEATENLKVALKQLTEEKKALEQTLQSNSDKETKPLMASLEKTKAEREAFRQRCENNETIQKNLQQELVSLQKQLQNRNRRSSSGGYDNEEFDMNGNDGEIGALKSSKSRVAQLKNYARILEERVGEKDETILTLRKENAQVSDMAMEKSLELSRSRRILEKRIEKLSRENSELKVKFLIPSQAKKEPLEAETQVGARKDHRIDGQKQQEISSDRNTPETEFPVDKEPRVMKPVEARKLEVAPKRRLGGKFIRTSMQRHSADLGKLMSRHHDKLSREQNKSDSNLLKETGPATVFVNKHRKTEEHWV